MDREQEIRRFFLLQVNDALFPIGGYSHSQGLETYIQQGSVCDEKTASLGASCSGKIFILGLFHVKTIAITQRITIARIQNIFRKNTSPTI